MILYEHPSIQSFFFCKIHYYYCNRNDSNYQTKISKYESLEYVQANTGCNQYWDNWYTPEYISVYDYIIQKKSQSYKYQTTFDNFSVDRKLTFLIPLIVRLHLFIKKPQGNPIHNLICFEFLLCFIHVELHIGYWKYLST